MNFLFQVVIPAISGLVSGTIASLVAPWINWRIEQKREKLAYKREMIRRWRQFLDRDRDFDEREESDRIRRDNSVEHYGEISSTFGYVSLRHERTA
jgi:hypothetical protein